LIAAALALGVTWPRPSPVANETQAPPVAASAGPPSDAGRFQLYYVPNYFQPRSSGLTDDHVGRTKGVTVYVLDTKTGHLLTEAEAKAVTVGK